MEQLNYQEKTRFELRYYVEANSFSWLSTSSTQLQTPKKRWRDCIPFDRPKNAAHDVRDESAMIIGVKTQKVLILQLIHPEVSK